MARVLGVSRSGFDGWRKRQAVPSRRRVYRQTLDAKVKEAFIVGKRRSGSPRLADDLADAGFPVDRKTVAASLRRQGLFAKAAKKFKATTNSKHSLPVSPNPLNQDFSAKNPNEKWVGDITYLWTDEGWMYLATVIDLFSRRVVGWAMSERMTATLVCDALMMALWRRGMPEGVIFHSDRGSMSAKGNCYDNACAEVSSIR